MKSADDTKLRHFITTEEKQNITEEEQLEKQRIKNSSKKCKVTVLGSVKSTAICCAH